MLINALWLIPAAIGGVVVGALFFKRTEYVYMSRTERGPVDLDALRDAKKGTPEGKL